MPLSDDEFRDLFSRDDGAMLLKLMYGQHQELLRQSRKLYDYSHPVDEYEWGPVPGTNVVNIRPNFGITERIESITLSIPVGVTDVTLQLDQRYIVLYHGTTTTVQTLVNLVNLGILLEETHVRQIVFTGAPTTNFYVSLAGHCLERTGNR